MGRRATKIYKSGDQIHIAVTQNFEDVATDFFQFCKDNHYNPSEVIRSSMEQWLQKQQRIKEMMEGNLERDAKEAVERERRILERLKEGGLSG